MYRMIEKEDTIRITPDLLREDFSEVVVELTRRNFEGTMDGERNLIVYIMEVSPIGEGKIVHGDGAIYQKVRFKALAFQPLMYEIVEGFVVEVSRFGVFIRFGPLDGLIHISQIMDDHIDVDLNNQRLVGKESKRDLRQGDWVRARIVSMSINQKSPRESRIGL
ncbi:MAG: DNA-directed RNA polymerase, partial [Deltaproteobacteria bacterium]